MLIIPTGMFYPVAFIYSLIFVRNPSLLGEQRLWTYEDTNWNESGCFVTALAFNISNFYFEFCSYQFVIKLLTTLAIIICCRLMWFGLCVVHIWCLLFYVQRLSFFNLMSRRFIFFVKWTVMYRSSQWDLSKCDDL